MNVREMEYCMGFAPDGYIHPEFGTDYATRAQTLLKDIEGKIAEILNTHKDMDKLRMLRFRQRITRGFLRDLKSLQHGEYPMADFGKRWGRYMKRLSSR